MGNVFKLDDYRYSHHISGDAQCLDCTHQWNALAPVGTIELQCPSCSTMRGVFSGAVSPDEVLSCPRCGNHHHYISDNYFMCARCGETDLFKNYLED